MDTERFPGLMLMAIATVVMVAILVSLLVRNLNPPPAALAHDGAAAGAVVVKVPTDRPDLLRAEMVEVTWRGARYLLAIAPGGQVTLLATTYPGPAGD